MNIVKDVITARCMNLRVFAISIVMGLYEHEQQPGHGHNSDEINFLKPFYKETEKSISLLILIVKEFIKLCL